MKETNNGNEIEISVVMPCLNEEKAVGICIEKCQKVFRENDLKGEIIVVDNGSSDRSREVINSLGAKLIEEPRRGYGSAYLRGFSEAIGQYFIMGDNREHSLDSRETGFVPGENKVSKVSICYWNCQ